MGGVTGASGAPGTAGSPGVGTAGSGGAVGGGNNGNGAGAGGMSSGGTAGSSGTTGAGGGAAGGPPAVCAAPTVSLTGADAVVGKLIQFNDNGGWCWYQDERAVVDTKSNKLVIASEASGGSRNGHQEAVIYNLADGTKSAVATLGTAITSDVDDHDAPALLVRPDGKYVALWSSHRADCFSRWSIYDGTAWSAEKKYDWGPNGCPWPTAATNKVTYSNPWYVGTSILAGVRSIGTDPAVISSDDNGETWKFYGRLMSSKQVGYVAGYFKYWGNNTDRIDFVGTEAHPRDADTSLYHGYIKDGMVYTSTGTVIDSSLKDASASSSNSKDITLYTPVFKTGSTLGGVKLEHAWNHDIVRYADGTIAILGQARVSGTGSDDPDKRMLYFRFDGTSWKSTYLVKAGKKLYADEQDYTGLGALVPDDPSTIYISTPYDPNTDMMGTGKREIWRGTTCDNGATFKWTPVTANSTKDNIRPIVPKWDANHTALLWMQGTYSTAQKFATAIVGTITGL